MENIYDELDNFERVKEYDELKEENVRLHKCIVELEAKISQLTEDNTRLSASLSNIEKSFAALLNTAKAEIERKTEMIATLNMEKDQLIFRHIGNRNNPPNGLYSKNYGRVNSDDTASASQGKKRKSDCPPSIVGNKILRLESQNDVSGGVDGSATLIRTKGDENRNCTAVRQEDAGCVQSGQLTRPNSPRFSSDDENEPYVNRQKYVKTSEAKILEKIEMKRRSNEEKTPTAHTNKPGGSLKNVKVRKYSPADPTRRSNRDTERYNNNVDSVSVHSQNVEKEERRQRRQLRSSDRYEEGYKTLRKSSQEFDEDNEKPRYDKMARDGRIPRLSRKEPGHRFKTSRTRFERDKFEEVHCRSRSPGLGWNGRNVKYKGPQYIRDSNNTHRKDGKRFSSPPLGRIKRAFMKQHEPEYRNENRKTSRYERSRSRHGGNDEIERLGWQSKIDHEINEALIDRTTPENGCDRANNEIHTANDSNDKQQGIENDGNKLQEREEELSPATDQCRTVNEQEKQNCDDYYRKCDAIELTRRSQPIHMEEEQTKGSQYDRAVIERDSSVGVKVCQSPDEVKGSNRGVTNENCRIIPDKGQLAVLDDPRLYSEKYFTFEHININKVNRLAPVKELCKFTLNIRERNVGVDLKILNYKTTTPPPKKDEDLIEEIYNGIEDELSNTSLESGEIDDSDDFDLHSKTEIAGSVGEEPKDLAVKEILEANATEVYSTLAKQDTVKISVSVPAHEVGQQFIKAVQRYRIPRINSTSQDSGTRKVSESKCEQLEENITQNKQQKNNKYNYGKISKSKEELKKKSDKILADIFQKHTDATQSGLEEQYSPNSKKTFFESQSNTNLRRKQKYTYKDSYKNSDEHPKSVLDKMLKTVEYEENKTNNSQFINSSEDEIPLKHKDSMNLIRPDNDSELIKVAKLEEKQSHKSFRGHGKEKSSTPSDSTSVIEDNFTKIKKTDDLKTSTYHNKKYLDTGGIKPLSKCKSSKKFEIEGKSGKGSSKMINEDSISHMSLHLGSSGVLSTENTTASKSFNHSKIDKKELPHEKKSSEGTTLSRKASKTSDTEKKIKSCRSDSQKESKGQKIKPGSRSKDKDKLKQEHRKSNSRNHKGANDEHKKETVVKMTDLFGENSLITPEDLQNAQTHVIEYSTINPEREFELNGFNDLVGVENISTFLRPELNNELRESFEHIMSCKIRKESTEKLCNGSIKEEIHSQTSAEDNRDGNTNKEVLNSSPHTVDDHSQSGFTIKIVEHINYSKECGIGKGNVSDLEISYKKINKPSITENVTLYTKRKLQTQTKIQDYPLPNNNVNEIPKDMPLISIFDLRNDDANQDTNCKNVTNQESKHAEKILGDFLSNVHYKKVDIENHTASDCEPSNFATSTPNPKRSPECSSKKVLCIPSPINEMSNGEAEDRPPSCSVNAPNENSMQSIVNPVVDPQQENVSPGNNVTGRRKIRIARSRRVIMKDP